MQASTSDNVPTDNNVQTRQLNDNGDDNGNQRMVSHNRNIIWQNRNVDNKCGIILDPIDNLKQMDYLSHIKIVVPVINIFSISKISGGRICIYFNEKKWADKLIIEGIVINNQLVNPRPVVNPPTKLLVSNCPPEIPDDIITTDVQIR
jgi:hypothetical protein